MVSSSWSKRQATIHLTIRASGPQVVPPVLIVTGRGMRGTPEEIAHWLGLKHVLVYYQPKAWCDRHFQAWYLLNVFDKYIKKSGDFREQLLCLDNLSSHKTPEVLELMIELKITPHWLLYWCSRSCWPSCGSPTKIVYPSKIWKKFGKSWSFFVVTRAWWTRKRALVAL